MGGPRTVTGLQKAALIRGMRGRWRSEGGSEQGREHAAGVVRAGRPHPVRHCTGATLPALQQDRTQVSTRLLLNAAMHLHPKDADHLNKGLGLSVQ